ncbi:MAG: AIR synthase family protein [Thermoplasmatales archaeon]
MNLKKELPELGKLPPDVFSEIIYPNTGKAREEVAVMPAFGVDFGVVELGDLALIVKTDPVFIVPEYGWKKSSWFAVNILASDVSVSGSPPMYMAIDLNLPKRMKRDEFEFMWKGISDECKNLGISIVAGHTGKYEGTDYPMIGGATMLSVTSRDGYITTQMAKPGDKVLMTKGPAIEAAGILSSMFPGYVEKKFGREFADNVSELFYRQSVVKDALTLAKIGLRTGVTSMHDATEYGVWGALHDIADASGYGIEIQEDLLFYDSDAFKVLNAFAEVTGIEADPFAAISEGTLVATVKPERAEDAVKILRNSGINAGIIGEVKEDRRVTIRKGSATENIKRPEIDPFWPIFFKSLQIFKG